MTEESDRLIAGLRWYFEREDWNRRAAVRVLIHAVQGKWMRDGLFRSRCVGWDGSDAVIDWEAASELAMNHPGSSGELALLRFACSLAGFVPAELDDEMSWMWSIQGCTRSLDADGSLLVLDAMQTLMTGS